MLYITLYVFYAIKYEEQLDINYLHRGGIDSCNEYQLSNSQGGDQIKSNMRLRSS